MNMDPPVSRHRPLGHNWCPASPSWDQLLSKKGKQIYFLLFQEINIAVVEWWFMFQPNIYFRISDNCRYKQIIWPADTCSRHTEAMSRAVRVLAVHCKKRKNHLLSFRKKNIFFINNLLLPSFHNKSLAVLLGRWKITTFQKGQTQRFFFGQNWIVRNVGEMFCRMGTIRWVIRTWRRPRTE